MATARWHRGLVGTIPLAVLGIIVVVDALLPPGIVVSGAFGIAAIVASALVGVRQTALVAGAAVLLTGLSALWHHNLGTVEWWVRIIGMVILGALAMVLAEVRVRRERRLRHMTDIAETAQRALLRRMPRSIGSLGFAARYRSATEEAFVGGDLYEVVETEAGVRVIVGDVRGKGLDAVQLAATVLTGFRRAAFTEASLSAAARDLDDVVTSVAGDEDFVTAVLAEFHDDHTVTLVNCGHPPPLLVPEAEPGRLVDTGASEPPLGLGPSPDPVTFELPDHARLLFYTDGLIETRNHNGDFLSLDHHVLAALRTGSPRDALDALLDLLDDHAAHDINDDIALLLVEREDAA